MLCINYGTLLFKYYYRLMNIGAQLFKTNDVVSKRIVKTSIIKYGILANIFTEKIAKATHIFFSKNTCELDIVLTRALISLTANELVKLTTL